MMELLHVVKNGLMTFKSRRYIEFTDGVGNRSALSISSRAKSAVSAWRAANKGDDRQRIDS